MIQAETFKCCTSNEKDLRRRRIVDLIGQLLHHRPINATAFRSLVDTSVDYLPVFYVFADCRLCEACKQSQENLTKTMFDEMDINTYSVV